MDARCTRSLWRCATSILRSTSWHQRSWQCPTSTRSGISRSIVISIGHIVPVDGRILRNALHGHLSIVLPIRGASVAGNVRLHTPYRAYAMVVHDLRHRRCHTSRHAGLTCVEELRTIRIIRRRPLLSIRIFNCRQCRSSCLVDIVVFLYRIAQR